jgi:hypothetical protein
MPRSHACLFPAAFGLSVALVAQDEPRIPLPPLVLPDSKAPCEYVPKPPAPPPAAAPDVAAVPPKPMTEPAVAAIGETLADPDLVLFDQPVAGGPLYFTGNNYKARFVPGSWEFVARPAQVTAAAEPVRFTLRSCTVGNQALEVGDAAPVRTMHRVEFAHGGFAEIVAMTGRAVEQSFRFDALPERGDLRLAVAVATGREAVDRGDRIVFRSVYGDVDYGEATAIDAHGNRCAVPTELVGDEIVIRVPASFVAAARLPLVVDPIVATQTVFTHGTADVANPDIAWDESAGCWAVAFERPYSADDVDVYVQRLNSDMTLRSGLTTIDISFDVWQRPKIANLNAFDRFLAVAQVSTDATWPFWIGGRILDNAGIVLTGQFDIARATVAGHAGGDKIRPDVAGDSYPTSPCYFTVVWEREASVNDHDIHLKQVRADGLLRSAAPTLVDNATSYESMPAIAKSACPGRMVVCYQRTHTSSDEDIRAAVVTWAGQPIQFGSNYNFSVDYSAASDLYPEVSSANAPYGTGWGYAMCVYQRPGSGNGDVMAAIIDLATGAVPAHTNISNLGGLTPAWPQFNPSVDSDGTRFAVVVDELFNGSGTDIDNRVILCGYRPTTGSIVYQHASTVAGSSAPEWNASIASVFAGSGVRSPRQGIVFERNTATPFEIVASAYEGYVVGGYTVITAACGIPTTITPSGQPIIGQTVDFLLTPSFGPAGFVFGQLQTLTPIPSCPGCVIGVDGAAILTNPLRFTIPPDPFFTGMVFALQGCTFIGGPCLNSISVSDVLRIRIE